MFMFGSMMNQIDIFVYIFIFMSIEIIIYFN